MTNYNFDIPQRYDETTAEEGVWFSVIDEHETLWGKFKCAMLDTDSRRVKLVQDRMKAKFAKDIRTKAVDNERLALEVFLGAILLDWREVKAGGKDVPYSEEAARAYFELPHVTKFALPELLKFAQDVRNYPKVDKDELAGN